jgi:glyoxylase-like metal-dependent hydrolase (beta-lactamase superfamily II)
MRRFFKFLFFLFLLMVVAVLGMNLWRLTFTSPEPIQGSVTRVHNAFVDFYAAKNGPRVLLFDAGSDPLGRGLDALLTSMSASRDVVTDLFLTHGHVDHLGAASLMRGARLHAGAKDAGLIEGTDIPVRLKVMAWIQPVGAAKLTDPLNGAAQIDVGGGQSVKAIPIPGHTQGSYFFLWERVLFVGDSINYDAKKDELQLPPDLFNDDTAQLKKSIGGLGKSLAGLPFDRICTGHGGCTPKDKTKKLLDDLLKKMQ